MQLYIVRHGIAIDRDDPKCPSEAERYLTEEGVEKTRQAAKGIAALEVHADLMISSPYVRAMQTAEIFAGALDYPKQKIRSTDSLLPGAEPGAFLRELAREKNASSVFCFGHAPHVDALLATSVGAQHHITSMKKAGVAFVELRRLSPPSGHLIWLATPKLIRKSK
ncbi:MAG TPA: phosphohistidine phosphatase SixA [Candidatus Saccharimonadales bacterium]|jgi:phosphohistidine phosphatase|nr:phosphohistidine phosphatase SixA [Candidatus Saccharimonadales bacterium]